MVIYLPPTIHFIMYFIMIADKYSFYNLIHVCLDDGKLKMEVTGTTMATGGEAKGQVTCKVIVGKCYVM